MSYTPSASSLTLPPYQRTIFVDPDGNSGVAGVNPAEPTTLDEALNTANSNNDTLIMLAAGQYTAIGGTYTISGSNVTLSGLTTGTSSIVSSGVYTANIVSPVVITTSTIVALQNLLLDDVTVQDATAGVLFLDCSSSVDITDKTSGGVLLFEGGSISALTTTGGIQTTTIAVKGALSVSGVAFSHTSGRLGLFDMRQVTTSTGFSSSVGSAIDDVYLEDVKFTGTIDLKGEMVTLLAQTCSFDRVDADSSVTGVFTFNNCSLLDIESSIDLNTEVAVYDTTATSNSQVLSNPKPVSPLPENAPNFPRFSGVNIETTEFVGDVEGIAALYLLATSDSEGGLVRTLSVPAALQATVQTASLRFNNTMEGTTVPFGPLVLPTDAVVTEVQVLVQVPSSVGVTVLIDNGTDVVAPTSLTDLTTVATYVSTDLVPLTVPNQLQATFANTALGSGIIVVSYTVVA